MMLSPPVKISLLAQLLDQVLCIIQLLSPDMLAMYDKIWFAKPVSCPGFAAPLRRGLPAAEPQIAAGGHSAEEQRLC